MTSTQQGVASPAVACMHCRPGFALIVSVLPYLALPGLDEEGRSKRSAAAKKPRSKQLLCEQDPEAPGLTLEQRRKIRRRINNRASARRVRQKREEDLQKITTLVSPSCSDSVIHVSLFMLCHLL